MSVNDTAEKSVLAGELYQNRVVYAVERSKSFPKLLVLYGWIPFFPNRLLRNHLPKLLIRILGICSFYERNLETNQQLICNTIQQYFDKLIEFTQMSDSDIGLLAAIQALILLQILRLFDGDIRQRANAEHIHPFFL